MKDNSRTERFTSDDSWVGVGDFRTGHKTETVLNGPDDLSRIPVRHLSSPYDPSHNPLICREHSSILVPLRSVYLRDLQRKEPKTVRR